MLPGTRCRLFWGRAHLFLSTLWFSDHDSGKFGRKNPSASNWRWRYDFLRLQVRIPNCLALRDSSERVSTWGLSLLVAQIWGRSNWRHSSFFRSKSVTTSRVIKKNQNATTLYTAAPFISPAAWTVPVWKCDYKFQERLSAILNLIIFSGPCYQTRLKILIRGEEFIMRLNKILKMSDIALILHKTFLLQIKKKWSINICFVPLLCPVVLVNNSQHISVQITVLNRRLNSQKSFFDVFLGPKHSVLLI